MFVPTSNPGNTLLQADGIIQHLDTVKRELRIVVTATAMCFDVPSDCAVILNGERVKLRLLQPTDRVTVFYLTGPRGLHTARRVVAQPGNLFPTS